MTDFISGYRYAHENRQEELVNALRICRKAIQGAKNAIAFLSIVCLVQGTALVALLFYILSR